MSIALSCDLRNQFGAVRDQHQRQTCLAFATSDTHGSRFTPFRALSVEFLFYHAVQLMPTRDPNAGLNMAAATTALNHPGQPEEIHWPYNQAQPPSLAQWVPPTNCPLFTRVMTAGGNLFDEICASLDLKRPVIVALRLTRTFFAPDADGLITHNATDAVRGSHAVIAVGHGRAPTGRCLLIRNSWGDRWGLAGYAFVEESYVAARVLSTGIVN